MVARFLDSLDCERRSETGSACEAPLTFRAVARDAEFRLVVFWPCEGRRVEVPRPFVDCEFDVRLLFDVLFSAMF